MTIREALHRVRAIQIPGNGPPVLRTAAETLGPPIVSGTGGSRDGVLRIACGSGPDAFLQLRRDGSGFLSTSRESRLFGFVSHLLRDLGPRNVDWVREGRAFTCAFSWNRSTYDFFLNQEGRVQAGLDPDAYVRRLAESGFTHVEVNALAAAAGSETGPPGEAYPMFYTYCPALDQFVSSRLNQGIYPAQHLQANLARLKKHARLTRRYGLAPGLLCFEPRSVPERIFERYPMLRGARVDHPFRSFKPRYNLTIAHPAVRDHYAEMLQKLLAEVPELSYLAIWTNDSGAGFEHTQSLYVGRNGGAYLIREWKTEADIARAAGENALTFFRALRDAACAIHPGFRVLLRLEPFQGEHDVIWRGLEKQVDVEAASLVGRGWEMPYPHPRYPDVHAINPGTVHQAGFDEREEERVEELRARGSQAHLYFAAGPHALFAPLIGVPYPTLTHDRLRLLRNRGIRHLAHLGGTAPPGLVPYNVNHEVLRRFQYDPEMEIDSVVRSLAIEWAGEDLAAALVESWRWIEDAILAFPPVTPLYATYGFVWYRLWARPLVPNIEAIPLAERAYYQNHMCTTPHNPNNVDLSRDVLFQLATADGCRTVVERMDADLWPPLDRARSALAAARPSAGVIEDQAVRLAALRCWFMTQRNVAAWIASVCGYLESDDPVRRSECRRMLDDLIEREIANSRELATLCDSPVAFMATSARGESALMHGDNLAELLERRVALMQRHRGDEPYIDPRYTEREAGP